MNISLFNIKANGSYKKLQNFCAILLLLTGIKVHAKGLDSFSAPMKPSTPAPTTNSTSPSTSAANAPTTASPSVANPTSPGTAAASAVVENSTEAKTFVKSEISKRLENKLILGMNFGWMGLSASEGDWSARALAGVEAGYEFMNIASFPLFGTLGFHATDATLIHKKDGTKNNYRALIQTYSLGLMTKKNFKEAWSWRVSGDLDMNIVSLDSLDGLVQDDIDDELKASGVSVRVYGGADWKWQENFLIGPGLGLSFGRFSSFQILAKSTFVF